MGIDIRPMTESDAQAVSRIVSDGYADLSRQERFSGDQTERLLKERSTVRDVQAWVDRWQCFVAGFQEAVVGALAIDGNDIAEIWIARRHRRKGVGTALFRHAELVIAGAGFGQLTVRCAAAGVRPFYQAMGCVVVGVRPCASGPLTGWPLTHYRKALKTQP